MKITKIVLKIWLIFYINALIFGIITDDYGLLLLYICISLIYSPILIIIDLLMNEEENKNDR